MSINSESLIPIIVTLAAAAVGLCYLPLVSDVVTAITERQRKRRSARQSAQQLEQKVLAQHRKILNEIETQTRADVKATLGGLEEMCAAQMTALAERYQNGAEGSQQKIKAATDEYLDETHLALQGLVEKAAGRIDEELTKQLQTAQTELENYKKNQLQKIDNEIATLVEKTIYKVLGKGLSRADHLDIIYEALAEAKEGGFFANNAK